MTIVLTFQEIAQWRSQLFAYTEALQALDEIENCDGDLEDAAIDLAIRAGQEPTTSEGWLAGWAKRYRAVICAQDIKNYLLTDNWAEGFGALLKANICPPTLVTPMLIYVWKTGVENFCEPLAYQINRDEASPVN